jgi:cytochrome c2
MRVLHLLALVGSAGWALAGEPAPLGPKDVAEGRKIYVAKCAKCHRFYEPMDYTGPEWQDWMGRMIRKSKLKTAQADLITRYLDAYRAGQLPGKPEDKPGAAGKR